MVLAEYAGKIVSHERGLRSQYCRVKAILDWDSTQEISAFGYLGIEAPKHLLDIALKHFLVPLLKPQAASDLIRTSNKKIVIGKSGFQVFQP